MEFEQGGRARAEYGKGLIEQLSKDLSLLHGRGFSLSNIKRMRQFYLVYPISAKPSHQLSWSHYVELLKIDDAIMYEKINKYVTSSILQRLAGETPNELTPPEFVLVCTSSLFYSCPFINRMLMDNFAQECPDIKIGQQLVARLENEPR